MPKKKPDSPEPSDAMTKSLSVKCRYCGQKNAVKADYVNDAANCGRCKLPLSNEPHKKFTGLHKDEYIHPADAKALAALKAIPGVDSALKKLLAWTGESAIRVSFMASAVKVTPKQCPDLHAKLEIACSTLGVEVPDMFVQQNPQVNAFTGGVEKPIIVLHSALIERLSDEETLAVIAHEVGHIHAEHVLYLTAARLMEALINVSAARLLPGSEIIKLIISMGIASGSARLGTQGRIELRPLCFARHTGRSRHWPHDDETRRRHICLKDRLRAFSRTRPRFQKELRRQPTRPLLGRRYELRPLAPFSDLASSRNPRMGRNRPILRLDEEMNLATEGTKSAKKHFVSSVLLVVIKTNENATGGFFTEPARRLLDTCQKSLPSLWNLNVAAVQNDRRER